MIDEHAGISTPGTIEYAKLSANTYYTVDATGLIANRVGTAGFRSILANFGQAAGRWYYEMKSADTDPFFGIGQSSSLLSTYLGMSTASVGYYGHLTPAVDDVFHNGAGANSNHIPEGTWAANEWIGVDLDLDNRTIRFTYALNTWGNIVESGFGPDVLAGDIYPGASYEHIGASRLTFNFGASAFIHNVPSGCNSGFYRLV